MMSLNTSSKRTSGDSGSDSDIVIVDQSVMYAEDNNSTDTSIGEIISSKNFFLS